MFRKPKAVVGLDIGSSAVKAVELRPAGRGYRIAAFGSEPVPPDSIVDGAIIDAGAVAEAIRRVFASHKSFKARDVCASLSGNAVIVKKITLPVMTQTELDESIYWEAEQYIPFDIQDVNLDYQILDPGTGPESRGSMDVLLAAAKKDKIGDYTSVIAQAGRTPVVVDVDAFALQNAYEVNYGLTIDVPGADPDPFGDWELDLPGPVVFEEPAPSEAEGPEDPVVRELEGPALRELEGWLAAIHADRGQRA